jgi:hypothetical protein
VEGYVYQRDGHPNAYLLAEKCRLLHAAERAAITASGMAALATAMLSQLASGDHVVIGSRVYGKTLQLFGVEARLLGIEATPVDTCDLAAVEQAVRLNTRLIVAETIANPLLEVADIAGLAEIATRRGVTLLIDNTFASPILCRPLALGANLVMESLTKTMNGHSDVILGLLAGKESVWSRVGQVISAFGSPSGAWRRPICGSSGPATTPWPQRSTCIRNRRGWPGCFIRAWRPTGKTDWPSGNSAGASVRWCRLSSLVDAPPPTRSSRQRGGFRFARRWAS